MKIYNKKCQVVLSPTEGKSILALHNNELGFVDVPCNESETWYDFITEGKKVSWPTDTLKFQHLYITCDDEIKEGDTCFSENFNHIYLNVSKETADIANSFGVPKIIASTDTSLKIRGTLNVYDKNDKYLPSFPVEFLYQYISEFNWGEPIKDIYVEYDPIYQLQTCKCHPETCTHFETSLEEFIGYELVINHNNQINITKYIDKLEVDKEELQVLYECQAELISLKHSITESGLLDHAPKKENISFHDKVVFAISKLIDSLK